MPYAEATDLLLGNIPKPPSSSANDATKYVELAAEEMDAALGGMYVTPIVLDDSPANRPAKLILKKINIHIATGRLLMAADAAGSDDQVHQYAKYILEQGLEALKVIASGEVDLVGPEPITPDISTASGPRLYNQDSESNVEAFYDRVVPAQWPPAPWPGPLFPYEGLRG